MLKHVVELNKLSLIKNNMISKFDLFGNLVTHSLSQVILCCIFLFQGYTPIRCLARSLRTQPNRILHQVPRPQCNSKRSAWGKINEHILVVYIFVNNVHGSWKPGPHAAGKNIFFWLMLICVYLSKDIVWTTD